MQRTYELTFVLSPQLSSAQLAKLEKTLASMITARKGSVVKKEDWGTRRLTYVIAKQTEGVYRHWVAELPSNEVDAVNREFILTQGLLRHLLVLAEGPQRQATSNKKQEKKAESTEQRADSSKKKITTKTKKIKPKRKVVKKS